MTNNCLIVSKDSRPSNVIIPNRDRRAPTGDRPPPLPGPEVEAFSSRAITAEGGKWPALKRRARAVETLKKDLTDEEKTFLVSVKSGQPNWIVSGIKGIEKLPANIRKIGEKKRAELLEKLERTLGF